MFKLFKNNTIQFKTILLLGVFATAIVLSTLFIDFGISASKDAIVLQRDALHQQRDGLGEQREALDRMFLLTAAQKAFDEFRYWKADMMNSLSDEAENKAQTAKADLEFVLEDIIVFAPSAAEVIGTQIAEMDQKTLDALDAYIFDERAKGNKLMEAVRKHALIIDESLDKKILELESQTKALAVKADSLTNTANEMTDIVKAKADSTQFVSRVALIIGAFLSLFITLMIIRTTIIPLKKITQAVSSLANGDLGIEIPYHKNQDEIGELARAAEIFRQNTQKANELAAEQREGQKAQIQRAANLDKLTEDFDNIVSNALKLIFSSTDELETTAQSMGSIAEETHSQASAVSNASETATISVNGVASATEELTASISEIRSQVDQSSKIAASARQQAENTNEQIKTLAEAANKISNVIGIIQGIAEQTNLLALNATIEAARAGEAGKGFAVVANEVKALANETAKATEEVSQHIQSVQEETENAVVAIGDISKTIHQIDDIAKGIAQSMEEQEGATREISRNAQDALGGTQQVSSNITGVSQASGETGQASTMVMSSVEGLKENMQDLRSNVDEFLKAVKIA